jgi:hypothetical protein
MSLYQVMCLMGLSCTTLYDKLGLRTQDALAPHIHIYNEAL